MYAEFYGLTALPFQLVPDSRFFFGSSVHRKAMAHLTYGLHQGEGFIIITGEVGAGKTTLVDYLLSSLDPTSHVAAQIVTTQLGADDMLRMVAAAFGLYQEGAEKAALLRRIETFVTTNYRSGKRSLLIVDEAQNLSMGAVEELRMLSNIMIDRVMPLQSFLLGQPQFRGMIASPELEQLRQRVTASYHLGPIDAVETKAYIEHRLKTAGWKDDPEFTDGALQAVYSQTGGVPRRINTLCSRLMLFGFLEELHIISEDTVTRVAEELRSELSQTVATGELRPHHTTPLIHTGDPATGELARRIGALETSVGRHDKAIRRALEIAASYVQGFRQP